MGSIIKLSLPETPDVIEDVEVPVGEEMESSISAENAFGKGGGTQFKILSKLVESWFRNPQSIQTPLPDINVPEFTPNVKPPVEDIPPIEDLFP